MRATPIRYGCAAPVRLATLDAAKLFDAAVVLPGGVGVPRVLHLPQLVHCQVTADPVFNAAV